MPWAASSTMTLRSSALGERNSRRASTARRASRSRWAVPTRQGITRRGNSMTESITIPETSRRLKTEEKEKVKKQPPYHVVLHNDDDHSFEYVIGMLQQLFGHPPEKGYKMAYEVHTKGRV